MAAFFEICGEPFAILVRHLVNIHAEKPFLFPFLAGPLGRNYYDDSFYRSLRQVEANEQEPADSGQVGFGESSADEGKPHPELADRIAMTARRLGIRDLPDRDVSIEHGNCGRKVGVITRATTAVSHLFRFLGRRSLMCAEGIEALENESTVVAKQLVEPKYTYKKDRVIIIALDPLALAPRALHTGSILAGFGIGPCAIMLPMKDMDRIEAGNDLDPVIEAYKKDVDVTLIRENLRLTVDQRFQQLMKLQQFAEDLRSGRKAHDK